MKILITGAAGFVGAYAVEAFAAKGYAVHAAILPQETLSPELLPLCTVHHFDLLDTASVSALLQEIQPDMILHLAAQSSVAAAWKQPQLTADLNIKGTVNLLEAARNLPVLPRILLTGSAEEYGKLPSDAEGAQLVSESAPLHPVNIYAATKAAAEQLAGVYAAAYGLPVICVRAFNHFGPKQREIFVVADFCRQAAEIELGLREPVIRTGNLDAKRDFTDVRDIVRAYVLLLESGRAGETYNIGSGKAAAISEMLDMILSCCRVPVRHEIDPAKLRPAETAYLAADITKLQKDTGWRPEIPTAQTIADTLDFWRQKLKEQSEA